MAHNKSDVKVVNKRRMLPCMEPKCPNRATVLGAGVWCDRHVRQANKKVAVALRKRAKKRRKMFAEKA